jgi:hypothetical protein
VGSCSLRSDWLTQIEEMCSRDSASINSKTCNLQKLSRGVQISLRFGYIYSYSVHNICTPWAISMDLDNT